MSQMSKTSSIKQSIKNRINGGTRGDVKIAGDKIDEAKELKDDSLWEREREDLYWIFSANDI